MFLAYTTQKYIQAALWTEAYIQRFSLPSELETFHLYSEECLTSIGCFGHWAARWHHRMLTDNLPKPHLPYTEQESSTEGRREDWRQWQMDGRGPKSRRIILGFAHFSPVFLCLYRGVAVPSTTARNSYLPGVFQFSQKRADPTAVFTTQTAARSRWRWTDSCKEMSSRLVFSMNLVSKSFCWLAQTLCFSVSLWCGWKLHLLSVLTVSMRRISSSPHSPPFCLLSLFSSLDGSLSLLLTISLSGIVCAMTPCPTSPLLVMYRIKRGNLQQFFPLITDCSPVQWQLSGNSVFIAVC